MISSQKGQPSLLNQINRTHILSHIRDQGCISRTFLAHATGLSIPTISSAVQYLDSLGLVSLEETGTSTHKGGRPPSLIRFDAEKNLAIGLDLDKYRSHLVLADFNAKIISEDQWDTPLNLEDIIKITSRKIRKIIKSVPSGAYFRGTGVAIAGLVNRKTGTIEYSRSIPWQNIEFASMLSSNVKTPVFIENEANLLALGELYFGMGKKYQNFLCIDIRDGIGCGVIHNHKLLDIPAELGQIRIFTPETNDLSSTFITLEKIASDTAMVQKAKETIQKFTGTSLLQKKIDTLNGDIFINAVKAGDMYARTIFKNSLSVLGLVLSGMVNMFHPEALIFHGPISENNPVFFSMLKDIISSYALSPLTLKMDLHPSSYGKQGVALGGLSLILHETLNLNNQLLNI